MRHSEFWDRLERQLGGGYARVWADDQVIGALGSRTVAQALDDGHDPKLVWRAVVTHLDLPPSQR